MQVKITFCIVRGTSERRSKPVRQIHHEDIEQVSPGSNLANTREQDLSYVSLWLALSECGFKTRSRYLMHAIILRIDWAIDTNTEHF